MGTKPRIICGPATNQPTTALGRPFPPLFYRTDHFRCGIVRGRRQEHADARHSLALLRARCERPRRCRAAESGQQFPPSDGDCHTPLPCEGALKGTVSRHKRAVFTFEEGTLSSASRSEAVRLRMRPGGEGKISSADRSGRDAASGLSCPPVCTVSPQSKLTCLSFVIGSSARKRTRAH